jgi:hypothetical protein
MFIMLFLEIFMSVCSLLIENSEILLSHGSEATPRARAARHYRPSCQQRTAPQVSRQWASQQLPRSPWQSRGASTGIQAMKRLSSRGGSITLYQQQWQLVWLRWLKGIQRWCQAMCWNVTDHKTSSQGRRPIGKHNISDSYYQLGAFYCKTSITFLST